MMPKVWNYLSKYIGNFIVYFPHISLAAIGLSLFLYIIFHHQKDISVYLWFGIIAYLYIYGLGKLELPIERMHFIEYGILSCLVFRALYHDLKNKLIYFWVSIIVFCIGFLDEGIQYILPNRVYNTHDVIVNGAAGILSQMIIAFILRPSLIPEANPRT
jgi:hypothetical protein